MLEIDYFLFGSLTDNITVNAHYSLKIMIIKPNWCSADYHVKMKLKSIAIILIWCLQTNFVLIGWPQCFFRSIFQPSGFVDFSKIKQQPIYGCKINLLLRPLLKKKRGKKIFIPPLFHITQSLYSLTLLVMCMKEVNSSQSEVCNPI